VLVAGEWGELERAASGVLDPFDSGVDDSEPGRAVERGARMGLSAERGGGEEGADEQP
jgi:hypothetical protein